MLLTTFVIKKEHQGKGSIPQKQTHTPVEFTMLQCSSCDYPQILILLPTSTEITIFISASPLLPCAPTSHHILPLFHIVKTARINDMETENDRKLKKLSCSVQHAKFTRDTFPVRKEDFAVLKNNKGIVSK